MPGIYRSSEIITALTLLSLSVFIIVDNARAAVARKEGYDGSMSGQGLYNASDNVLILNATNFKSNVYGSSTGWLVEFYNSWCGFCYRFAPIWKALAHDSLSWRDIVIVAAIDCADDDNNPICREYEIMQYPMLKYFPVNAHPSFGGTALDKADDLDSLRHNLIDRLEKEQEEGRGYRWPNITPYRGAETKDVWKAVSDTVKYFFLIFEKADSHLGAEVILDMHRTTTLEIRRVTSENELLCVTNGVTRFPSVIVFGRDGSQKVMNIRIPSREGVRNAIREYMLSRGLRGGVVEEEEENEEEQQRRKPSSTGRSNEESINSAKSGIPIAKASTYRSKIIGDILYRADLDSTLRYALHHEIPLRKSIGGAQMSVLRLFLKVLVDCFPSGRTASYLKIIESSLGGQESDISGRKFKAIAEAAEKASFPVYPRYSRWIGCKGSTDLFRGYPCGLWTLFHMLTVNSFALRGDDGGPRHEAPPSGLRAIYGYVKHFFGCSDCSRHFVEMADKNKMRAVRGEDESILWLWKAHNEVNARLAGDETEDPEHKKIQYPSVEHCPACRHRNGTWNEAGVLTYLKRKYSYQTMSYRGADTDEGETAESEVESRDEATTTLGKHGWDFTVFDISICVLLYIASATILILVCIKFAVKKTYRKKVYVSLLGKV